MCTHERSVFGHPSSTTLTAHDCSVLTQHFGPGISVHLKTTLCGLSGKQLREVWPDLPYDVHRTSVSAAYLDTLQLASVQSVEYIVSQQFFLTVVHGGAQVMVPKSSILPNLL